MGTAGWTLPRDAAEAFAGEGSHLARYGRRMRCAEINSSFHRTHRASTWRRWGESVPEEFRFAVKAPKTVTHEAKLRRVGGALAEFVEAAAELGSRLGPLLFQLPPKLEFEAGVAEEFLGTLREVHGGAVVMEPRHASWFEAEAGAMLRRHEVGRVAADPARVPAAGRPGGWMGLRYYRLHGSPRTYYTRYEPAYVEELAGRLAEDLRADGAEVWCVFDNTAAGAAIHNALELQNALAGLAELLGGAGRGSRSGGSRALL